MLTLATTVSLVPLWHRARGLGGLRDQCHRPGGDERITGSDFPDQDNTVEHIKYPWIHIQSCRCCGQRVRAGHWRLTGVGGGAAARPDRPILRPYQLIPNVSQLQL